MQGLINWVYVFSGLIAMFTHQVLAGEPIQQQPTSLTVPELIRSMQYNHPYINVLNEKAQQLTYQLEKAQSAFDPQINSDVSGRISGYYDGSALRNRVTLPIGEMNAKLFSQYRVATGDFPVYEEQFNTLSAGEVYLGVSLSLLKNRAIDKNRLGTRNARLAIEGFEYAYQSQLNTFLYKGVSDYLKWYEASLKIDAVTKLLSTLSTRKSGLETRHANGDLAEVVLTEFTASVLEQELTLASLQQQRKTTAEALAFFWRTANGEFPQAQVLQASPQNIQWPFTLSTEKLARFSRTLDQHPELALRRLEQQMMRNDARLAENKLLPTLDFKASVGRDLGAGQASLHGTESKIGLEFSYPLGNRKAKAQRDIVKSKQKVLQYEYDLATDKLRQQFQQASVFWEQATRILALQQKNADLAVQLAALEQSRFDAGDSDMFKLNARQSTVLQAKLKAIEARVELLRAELNLYRIIAGLMRVPAV